MSKEEIQNLFYNSLSKKQLCLSLGWKYGHISGNTIKKRIFELVSEHEIDLSKCKWWNDNSSSDSICLNCGKLIPFSGRKFCSSSCAASYNNKLRKHKSETKKKISDSLKQKLKNDPRPLKIGYRKDQKSEKVFRNCVVCGQEFELKRSLKTKKLSHSTTCSPECHFKLRQEKGREVFEKVLSEGRFQGWKSRNITSYAEDFWKDVLDNNGIGYIREYVVEVDKIHRYFLDFLIEINGVKIDLEIDGKQHTYSDRIENDVKRDAFLTSNGFQVYRIAWNEIVSEQGSLQMREKINSFLKYLETIK